MRMPPSDFNRQYRELLAPLDALTRASKEAFGDQIQCRQGCGMCCHGLFDIGVLDALLLHAAWREAPADVRTDIEARSEILLAQIALIAPYWLYPYDLRAASEDEIDAVLETLGSVACPVLSTAQGCRLYDSRPFYCRVHGLKVRDRKGANDIDTDCDLNFTKAIPPKDSWPSHSFSDQFTAEGELIFQQALDPASRFLIPAVTTARFVPFAEMLQPETKPSR
jgi:Fe-S-cluster containining protein